MLKGLDISHWNSGHITVRKQMIEGWKDFDFVIMKATEGATYTDRCIYMYRDNINKSKSDIVKGYYHFARANNNDPIKEAEHFLNIVGKDVGKSILALDFEGQENHNVGEEWAKTWMDYVYIQTGVKPIFYTDKYAVSKYDDIAKNDYGLWIPHWKTTKPDSKLITPWRFFAFWQYQGSNLDLDYFNGTKEALLKYTIAR